MSNNNITLEKRYVCNLSATTMEKAAKELREPQCNIYRLEEIDKLRNAFLKSNSGQLLRTDDVFFLKFLRAKKFDQVKALTMLSNYHKQRKNWPQVFEMVNNPISLEPVLKAGCMAKLPFSAKDGSTIVVGMPGKKQGMNVIEMIACIILTLDKLLENEEVQVHGVTVVDDLTYYDFNFAKQMTPKLGKKFATLIQDAMPVRLKSLNIVNEPKIFDVVLTLLRPFMKEKIKRRLHMHGHNYLGLHKTIDIDVLPKQFAGNGPVIDFESWRSELLLG